MVAKQRRTRFSCRALKPGGWIEMAEFEFFLYSDDGSLKETSHLWKYYVLVNEAAVKLGIYIVVSLVCQFLN